MVEFLVLASLNNFVAGFRKKANGTKINHKLYCSEISKVGLQFFPELYLSFPIRTSCWRSTEFPSEQYMSWTTMNHTLSTPMTGMRSISYRWSSFIQEGNNWTTRWRLCRQIIVPGLWCFSLSDLRGCGTAPRSPVGFSTLEISGFHLIQPSITYVLMFASALFSDLTTPLATLLRLNWLVCTMDKANHFPWTSST